MPGRTSERECLEELDVIGIDADLVIVRPLGHRLARPFHSGHVLVDRDRRRLFDPGSRKWNPAT